MPRTPAQPAPAEPDFVPAFIQFLSILILRPWFKMGFRITVRRSRHWPGHPCVLACNHRSFFDPPAVAIWSSHPLGFFARSSLWRVPIIGHTLRALDGIPVERENPGMSSMKGAVECLRSGVSVLVFPEGTRTKTGWLGPLRDGPALFARRAGVPLVPIYVHRTNTAWCRGEPLPRLCGPRVEVRFGRPLVPPAELDPRAQDAWLMRRLGLWMQYQERELVGRRKMPRKG